MTQESFVLTSVLQQLPVEVLGPVLHEGLDKELDRSVKPYHPIPYSARAALHDSSIIIILLYLTLLCAEVLLRPEPEN